MVVGQKGATYGDIQNVAAEVVYEGYDCQQLLNQLLDYYIVQPANVVSDLKKAKISEIIAMTEFQLLQGGNEELNMLNTLSNIGLAL